MSKPAARYEATREDRELIRDAARAFLADRSTSKDVRRAMATDLGYESALWAKAAREMGWAGVLVPSAHGGLGAGYAELAILMEEMGAALFCGPFFSTVCLALPVINATAGAAQKRAWLRKINDGTLTATLTIASPRIIDIKVDVRKSGASFVLNGTQSYVVDGHSADLLIVAARKQANVTLFALPSDTPGVTRRPLSTVDQTRRLAKISFDNVRVPKSALLGKEGQGWPVLVHALDLAAVALSAEQAGGARRCLEMTLAYAKEREQFGRPIGGFQAIKHRCADMMVQVESALAAAHHAAEAADAGDKEFPLFASLAKAYCSDAFFACAAECIQIHGGMGFTWEADPHLYFKRARAAAAMLGRARDHRERIADGIGL